MEGRHKTDLTEYPVRTDVEQTSAGAFAQFLYKELRERQAAEKVTSRTPVQVNLSAHRPTGLHWPIRPAA